MGAQISKVNFPKDGQRSNARRKVRKSPLSDISSVNFHYYSKTTINDKDSMFPYETIRPVDNPSIHSTDQGTPPRCISAKLPRRLYLNNSQKSTIDSPHPDMDHTRMFSCKSDDSLQARSITLSPSMDDADSDLRAPDISVFNRNDGQEYNRQLRQHYVMKQVLGGNLQIELDTPPKMILDSACGAGFWAADMAKTYPESKVIAMDITLHLEGPQTTEPQKIAPNIAFVAGDILSPPLPFEDTMFDLIYQREAGIVIPTDYWAPLLDDFARVLKPNGVLHLVEYDLGFPSCGPLSRIVNRAIDNLLETTGYERHFTERFESMLIESGFSDIRIQSFHIPIGEWPENKVELQHGFLMKDLLKGLLKFLKPRLEPYLQIFMNDYEKLCASVMDEIEANRRSYEWKVITARKI